MSDLAFTIGDHELSATVLDTAAPATADQLRTLTPLETTVKHVRWSGYSIFIEDFGQSDPDFTHLPRENHTVYPSRGDVLFYPGFENVPEILIACGPTAFKSPAGELAGNHVATLDADRDTLAAIETDVLENGTKPVSIRSD
ncbi:MAG: DUF3830 family protein [Halobacteriales archaeon]|nr:DUF3830 family protein [Halobacteriales archaeon]